MSMRTQGKYIWRTDDVCRSGKTQVRKKIFSLEGLGFEHYIVN